MAKRFVVTIVIALGLATGVTAETNAVPPAATVIEHQLTESGGGSSDGGCSDFCWT
jgi:hypothetical protein